MFFTFLIVVILTAIALVVAAMTISKLISPRSY
ncbi:MAG: NADH-quinone oxidoreductase subunit A, partial [Phocaeicola sp.]|nr:NADH-quinone oxidoreductase subunit A [Phocaeicola sp.]